MRDHVLVSDGENTAVVNQRSFCELIKWLLVEYLGVSYEAASLRVEEKADFFASLDNVMSAALESHNWPYYYTGPWTSIWAAMGPPRRRPVSCLLRIHRKDWTCMWILSGRF